MASNASYLSTKEGVNGSNVYDSTGDPRVDLSVMTSRGATKETLKPLMKAILKLGETDRQAYMDAFVLAFQTRNIRGGKGERDVSYMLFSFLLKYTPHMINMLDLIPFFGCWRDLFDMGAACTIAGNTPSNDERKLRIRNKIIEITIAQLRRDMLTPEGESISLCAKWAPREGKGGATDAAFWRALVNAMFPDLKPFSSQCAAYRKYLAPLNRRLNTVEIKMCAGDWEEIEPPSVPGRALNKYRAAFLNEVAPKKKGERVQKGELRHPHDEARLACRDHFKEHFAAAARGEVSVKGADTLYPHEVIKKILDSYGYDQYYGEEPKLSKGEYDLVLGQWRSFVEKARASGALRDCVALCDFSGSMDGTPKLVSLALGMLIAEVSGTNKFLTFDSEPKWYHMRAEDNIITRVGRIGNIGHGLSTDFQKAMDRLLEDVQLRRLRPEQIPKDLIVFTDMGFDEARASDHGGYRYVVKTAPWQTHIDMIRKQWQYAGENMWGPGNAFAPPRIVIWNLRAEYKDFHASAQQDGVIMLSGWSPALFKVIQEGRVEVMSPMAGLRIQLDDPMYECVRERLCSLL